MNKASDDSTVVENEGKCRLVSKDGKQSLTVQDFMTRII